MPNCTVLEKANMTSMHTMLSKRRLRWLGHVHRMDTGRLPREILYGELARGSRLVGRPNLRYKDMCKKDLKDFDIDLDNWEGLASERPAWRQALRNGALTSENLTKKRWEEKRERRKQASLQPSNFICEHCSRGCHSKIGLYSHTKSCKKT